MNKHQSIQYLTPSQANAGWIPSAMQFQVVNEINLGISLHKFRLYFFLLNIE